ncbi:MAG: hypothetical protein OSJ71_15225 [Acetatifactor sp.]|nr:hypothetical protein [Acetatifactor sp.]
MEKQNNIPPVLRAKTVLTFLTGVLIGTAAAILFAVSKDLTLLTLGGILSLWCLLKGWMLRRDIQARQYECVAGICTSVSRPPFRRYKKVHLILADGKETTLFLGLQTRIKPDTWYRFYFQSSPASRLGNEYLDAALSTNIFLGYEECVAEPDTPP